MQFPVIRRAAVRRRNFDELPLAKRRRQNLSGTLVTPISCDESAGCATDSQVEVVLKDTGTSVGFPFSRPVHVTPIITLHASPLCLFAEGSGSLGVLKT